MMRRRAHLDPKRQRGASLTEFAIVVPLVVAVFYASMYLTELGAFKLKAQEIARYGAWAFTQHPLSNYESDNFNHNDRFNRARDAVADELTAVYLDLDGAKDRALPIGAWGLTATALYEPAQGSDFRNQPAAFLPTWAQQDWASPLSTIGLILNFLGLGTGTESFASGPFTRLHFNHRGQVSARASVRIVPPIQPDRLRRNVAVAALGAERGMDLGRFLPTVSGRVLRDENSRPIETTLIADPWKIHEGLSAHPARDSGYARMVQEVSDNGLKALPGGQIIGFLTGLNQSLKKLPGGLTQIFGFQPSDPRSHLVSRPYTRPRGQQPSYRGTPQPGQVDIFHYVGERAQESGAVTNFETMPLYLDPESASGSKYLESLNERGPNFMGCRTAGKRGCWE